MVTIDEYKKKFELAEQARIELQNMIAEKTGHTCTAFTDTHPKNGRIAHYKIVCFSANALKDISALFTDKPFFQEEVVSDSLYIGHRYKISCHIKGLGAPLEILSFFGEREYKDWVRTIQKQLMGATNNE